MEKIPEIDLHLTTVEVKSEVRKLKANTKRWVRLPRKIKKQLKKEFASQQEWLEWSRSPIKFGCEAGDPIDVFISDEARDWFNRRNDPVEYEKMLSEQEA